MLSMSMYSLCKSLHSTRSKIYHGSVPLNKSLKDKKKKKTITIMGEKNKLTKSVS